MTLIQAIVASQPSGTDPFEVRALALNRIGLAERSTHRTTYPAQSHLSHSAPQIEEMNRFMMDRQRRSLLRSSAGLGLPEAPSSSADVGGSFST